MAARAAGSRRRVPGVAMRCEDWPGFGARPGVVTPTSPSEGRQRRRREAGHSGIRWRRSRDEPNAPLALFRDLADHGLTGRAACLEVADDGVHAVLRDGPEETARGLGVEREVAQPLVDAWRRVHARGGVLLVVPGAAGEGLLRELAGDLEDRKRREADREADLAALGERERVADEAEARDVGRGLDP